MQRVFMVLSSCLLGLFVSAPALAGTVTSDGADLILKTKGGFEVKTADGDYSFKVGGRMMLDYNSYDGVINTAEGETGSDIWFRRARLEIKGKAKDWSYLMSYNLTGGGSVDQLHASYNGFGKLALLTMGQQKEGFGLDDTGSSKWISGIERSLASDAFDVGNNLGIKLHGGNKLISYSVGVYKESIDADDNSLDGAFTGRFVVRPIVTDDLLVHLGAGFTAREGEFDSLGARLGVRGGDDGAANRSRVRYAGGLAGDEQLSVNLEAAATFGQAHIQAEYFTSEVSGAAAPDLEADGYYLQFGWVLTGENRSYKNGAGVFDKIKPSGSGGAWELFARYDALDVSGTEATPSITVNGGDATVFTLGANWYVNSNAKLSLNYVTSETDQPINGEDDGNAIVARLQYAF
ncbi:MAG: OprO/OprP family phosphate-selective porin [Pseudomonadales bacterium]